MRIYNSKNQNVNFGWYYKMHEDVVKKVAAGMGLDKKIISVLSKGAKKPDFCESFLLAQKHYYFPKNKFASFMDFTGKRNAKYMYKKHLEKMRKFFGKEKTKKALCEAGCALHYLQDMTQPNHINKKSMMQVIKGLSAHFLFEVKVKKMQNELFNNYSAQNFHSRTFEGLFNETVRHSLQNAQPKNENKAKWNEIGQGAYNLVTSATKRFLELMCKNRYI